MNNYKNQMQYFSGIWFSPQPMAKTSAIPNDFCKTIYDLRYTGYSMWKMLVRPSAYTKAIITSCNLQPMWSWHLVVVFCLLLLPFFRHFLGLFGTLIRYFLGHFLKHFLGTFFRNLHAVIIVRSMKTLKTFWDTF